MIRFFFIEKKVEVMRPVAGNREGLIYPFGRKEQLKAITTEWAHNVLLR